jgi:hypothetical protein
MQAEVEAEVLLFLPSSVVHLILGLQTSYLPPCVCKCHRRPRRCVQNATIGCAVVVCPHGCVGCSSCSSAKCFVCHKTTYCAMHGTLTHATLTTYNRLRVCEMCDNEVVNCRTCRTPTRKRETYNMICKQCFFVLPRPNNKK